MALRFQSTAPSSMAVRIEGPPAHAPRAANSSCMSSALSCIDVMATPPLVARGGEPLVAEANRIPIVGARSPFCGTQNGGEIRHDLAAGRPLHSVYSLLLSSTNGLGKERSRACITQRQSHAGPSRGGLVPSLIVGPPPGRVWRPYPVLMRSCNASASRRDGIFYLEQPGHVLLCRRQRLAADPGRA